MLRPFRPKRIRPNGKENRRGPTHCVEPNCGKPTKHGKTYCSDHITRLAYVQEVEARKLRRAQELSAIGTGDPLPDDSLLVGDVYAVLWERGSVSAPGLTRYIDVTHSQARDLLNMAQSRGICALSTSKRGKLMASALFERDLDADTPSA
jgi:hypothetical protein